VVDILLSFVLNNAMFCNEIIRERSSPGVLTYSQLRRAKKNAPTSRFAIKISTRKESLW